MIEHRDDSGYDPTAHEQALRLILASLRQDWDARDAVLDEIGDCPCCLTYVVLMLTGEASCALVGDKLNEAGDGPDPVAAEKAVEYVSTLLADVLDNKIPADD